MGVQARLHSSWWLHQHLLLLSWWLISKALLQMLPWWTLQQGLVTQQHCRKLVQQLTPMQLHMLLLLLPWHLQHQSQQQSQHQQMALQAMLVLQRHQHQGWQRTLQAQAALLRPSVQLLTTLASGPLPGC